MPAHRLEIQEVRRPRPIAPVGPADFETTVGSRIDVEEIFEDPRFSLYCFDLVSQAALFVEVEDPVALEQAPFLYNAQSQMAVGMASVPLEDFHRAAEDVAHPSKNLILIHSVGRCGSTLLSKVFGTVPGLVSLSEPDDLTQAISFRVEKRLSDESLSKLIDSSIRWRCRPRSGIDRWAIKTRSEVMVLADLVAPLFPDSKHLFGYRDPVAWIRTIYRGFPVGRDPYDESLNREMEANWSRTLPILSELRNPQKPLNAAEIRILGWISCCEAYVDMAKTGVPTRAIRFEDLVADPLSTIAQIMKFCEIDDLNWDAVRDVLSRDALEGTPFGRAERQQQQRALPDAMADDVRRLISRRPKLEDQDIFLPNTLGAI